MLLDRVRFGRACWLPSADEVILHRARVVRQVGQQLSDPGLSCARLIVWLEYFGSH